MYEMLKTHKEIMTFSAFVMDSEIENFSYPGKAQ